MFTIVISEKGGAERRETFDKTEIGVGRVQGNDLMLPKGNVSKQHARLLFRDARFIVTDLRSTNGTYVNGRKISQATIVREGDKIYIGDFVLRVETGQGGVAGDGSRSAEASGAGPFPLPPPSQAELPAGSPSFPADAPSQPGLPPMMAASVPPSPPIAAARMAESPNVSHFPLERDPDSESAPDFGGVPMPSVPGPPRLPQSVELRPRLQTAAVLAPSRSPASPRVQPPSLPVSAAAAVAAAVRPMFAGFGPARVLPKEAPHQAARRLALIALVARVSDAIDLGRLDERDDPPDALVEAIERTAREQAKVMRAQGEAAEGLDAELLVRDAVAEIAGLGPLGAWLDDDQTTEVHLSRPDYVVVTRGGQLSLAEPGFTGEDAVRRALVRFCRRAGQPMRSDETVIERRLAGGAHLVAIGPPIAKTWVVTIRKPRRIEGSLDDLVRAGALSRSMAIFLEACVVAKANVLVVGPAPALVASFVAALLAAAPAGDRVVVLQDLDEIAAPQAHVIALGFGNARTDERSIAAATRLGADRLVIASLGGSLAAATLGAIADGAEGVVAGVGAQSVRQGLGRLAAHVAMSRAGVSVEAAREAIGESFDVAVEIGRSASDGQLRVLRVAELAGADAKGVLTRDLFVSNPEGGDAPFVVTGTTPRLAGDFAARGVRLDASLFKRAR